jgi:hypothetical protein
MFLGTIIVLAVEGPAPAAATSRVPAEPLPLEQPKLLNNG